MWNLRTHSLVGARKVDHDARCVTPSSDGSRLVSLSKDEITLWDFTTGICLAYLRLGFRGHSRAAFAVDETNVCVESNAGTRSWRISPTPTINHRLFSDNEFTSLPMDSIPRPRKRKYQDILDRFTSLPMVFVPLPEERPHEDTSGHRQCYYLDKEWILDQNNRCVFWLPPDRTSSAADFYGKKVVVGDTSGFVYVVDFSDTAAPFSGQL
jgi:WD40 repeat protein